jgi:hypothetical protein
MSDVKALFPIGKTQWSKWNDKQKIAFNEACEAGVPFSEAVAASNSMKKGGLLGAIKEVAGVVEEVAEVAAVVTPVAAVASTVIKAASKKGK